MKSLHESNIGFSFLIRYPDDPFDRIWGSDSVRKANYLVDVAPGTERISTERPIDVGTKERPPQKVMQTAVVGRNGTLTYRLNLDGFPGFGWAMSYFAEIEDLGSHDYRKFRLMLPGNSELSKASVNIQENAQGKYRLYEPGYDNISLPFVLSFRFQKTVDSLNGPLLNAMEINKYLRKTDGSIDGTKDFFFFFPLNCMLEPVIYASMNSKGSCWHTRDVVLMYFLLFCTMTKGL